MALPTLSRKLTVLLGAVTALALLLGGGTTVAMEYFSARRAIVAELRAQAEVVGYSAGMAMAFQDQLGAQVELANLKASRRVLRAALYSAQGQVFASYPADATAGSFPGLPKGKGATILVQRDGIHLFSPNDVGTGVASFIYVQARTDEIWPRVWSTLKVQGLLMVGVFGVVLLFSLNLQRTLSDPLMRLVASVKRVGSDQDYGVRVQPEGGCQETQQLGESFNVMIAALQERDARLRDHQNRLEDEVRARTEELTQVNRELLSAKNRAEEASRAKSDFLAAMSHELRTPLNAVLLYSELLRHDAEDQGLDDLVPDIRVIHGAGKHLLGLIDGILDLAGIEAGKATFGPEWLNLKTLVDQAAAGVLPLMEKQGNRWEMDVPADLPLLQTDRKKALTLIFNLLENAAKFTRSGEVTCRAAVEGEVLRLEVRDTGIGMRPDQVALLFQQFTQAETYSTRKVGGLGLGLTLCQQITRLLGGRLDVESEEGKGSRFTLRLPLRSRVCSSALMCLFPVAPGWQATAPSGPGFWATWASPPDRDPAVPSPEPGALIPG